MSLTPGAKENEISGGIPSRIHNLDSTRERYEGEERGGEGQYREYRVRTRVVARGWRNVMRKQRFFPCISLGHYSQDPTAYQDGYILRSGSRGLPVGGCLIGCLASWYDSTEPLISFERVRSD